jgi:diguanylate cyclase (GGDEF)-like protein/PAS domain S-box-containing protein
MSADDRVPDAEWFEQMASSSAMMFFILRVHPDLALEFVNNAPGAVLVGDGTGPGGATDIDAASLLGQIDPKYADRLSEVLALPTGTDIQVELKWNRLDGLSTYGRGSVRSRQRTDGSVVIEGALADITELHEAQTSLSRSEKRSRLLAENAWEVIWTMAMDTKITYVSPAVEQVRGITPDEAKNQSLEEIHPPESAARVADYYQRVFAAVEVGAAPPSFRGELEYYRKDGSIMTGELQVIPHRDATGQVIELIGVTRDISERKAFEAELRNFAVTDGLTGVWNRRQGTELLAADLAARRPGQALSLLMLDIDHFKAINDTFGHQAGDHVLIEIASRLRRSLRGNDMVARWGGEEFIVLVRDCALPDAGRLAENIRAAIAEVPFGPMGRITVSIGAAEARDNEDLQSWLSRADQALYRAKRAGRNEVVADTESTG